MARRVEAPLEHVAIDDERAGDFAIVARLFDRTRVDDERVARGEKFCRLCGVDPPQMRAGRVERVVDGHMRVSAKTVTSSWRTTRSLAAASMS